MQAKGRMNPRLDIEDRSVRRRAVGCARERGVALPTFSELAGEAPTPEAVLTRLASVDPDAADAANLWRINWFNAPDRRSRVALPDHVVLPPALTGVAAPIVVLLGSRFPMIGAHKVLPAYACLVTRLVVGGFDPTTQRAVWPSTGNYCRGGVAVSRILGCSGVAVLPEGMSRERFEWLEKWVADPRDIVRTVGTESNVKEIYDKCHELEGDSNNVILNQFSAFANYMAHRACTGAAAAEAFRNMCDETPSLRLAAFVSATGSAGTIAAGDHLKERFGAKIVAVEALECPTLLENGYGEHNIQGIGDKRVPLIHNVMNTDVVVAVSDSISDRLNLLFNTPEGRGWLKDALRLDPEIIAALDEIGLSGIANVAASIKLARHMAYGADDAVVTVATDSARLYRTELPLARAKYFGGADAAFSPESIWSVCLGALANDNVLELDQQQRRRIFNLGYYTWVEQQGVALDDFDRRKSQAFWDEIANSVPAWDRLIEEFNAEAGLR